MSATTGKKRAQGREQLLHMEGLRLFVDGPGVEALHLVAPAVAGGQDQDGRLDAGAPPGGQNRDAVDLRQPEIEDDAVVGLRLAEELPLLAVEGCVDGVARVLERGHDLPVEVAIVLDDKK